MLQHAVQLARDLQDEDPGSEVLNGTLKSVRRVKRAMKLGRDIDKEREEAPQGILFLVPIVSLIRDF